MKDQDKTREQLKAELAELRRRIAGLEAAEAEHEQAKEALCQSEDRFRGLFESLPIGLFQRAQNRFLGVNSTMMDILGYPDRETLLASDAVDFFVDMEDRARWHAYLKREGGAVRGFEMQIRRYDGTVIWGRLSARSVKDDEGRLLYYDGLLEDITERKRAEELSHTQRDLALAIGSAFGLETLRLCLETAIRISGMDCGGIYLVDETCGALNLVLAKNLSPDFVSSASHYEADSPNAQLVMAGQPVYSEHLQLGLPVDEVRRGEGLRAAVVLPVRHEGRVIACLNVASHTLDEVPAFARTALETIAAQIGSAITRVQTEEALRESEDRYRMLAENVTDVVWAMDMNLKFTYVSPSILQLRGYTADEVMVQSIDRLIVPGALGEVMALLSQKLEMIESGDEQGWASIIFETEQPCKDGTTIWTRNNAKLVPDSENRPVGIIGVAHDITERRRTEEALRASQEHLQSLFDTMAEGVILIAADGQIVQANPAAERILRLERPDIQDRNYADLGWVILRPDKTPMPMEERPRLRAMETRQPIKDVVMGFGHADGAISWLNVSDAPILDQSGTIAGVVSTFADITERKQAEEALHLHTERLEILREIDQSILAAQSSETIAEVTLSRIRQLIPCQRTDILLYDSSSNGLLVLAVDAAVETKVREGAYASFERFADEIDVLRQDKVVILEEFRPRGKVTTAMYAEGVRSLVGVPMICQDELIGSLNFGMNTDALTFEHIDIARHVADSLAVAIQQARLYEQVKRQADELEQRVADRTRELSVLYKVAALASQSLGLETTLARSLEQVLEVVKSDAGTIHLLDETDGPADKKVLRLAIQQGISPDLVTRIESLLISEGLGEWLAERNKPFTVPGTTSILQVPMGPHAYVGMPLRASGRTLGTLSIARRSNQPQFNVEEFSLLTSVADQLGVVVEGARLRERAEQAAVFEERERLARELHDRVVQSLYSLTLFAEWGRDLFEDGELKAVKQRLVRIGETAHQALKEMRLLVYELRPALLEQDGLVKALQQRLDAVEKRSGVKVSLQARSVGRLPAPVEEGLYRIAQEALNNALKHAAASLVTLRVSVENDGEQVIMEIKDDGMGFMPDAVSHRGGLGLDSMRERAKRLGSELVVVSTPGEGTKVIVTVEVS